MGLKLYPEPVEPELDGTSAIEVPAVPVAPATEPPPTQPVKANWGPGDVSAADHQARAAVESHFGDFGLRSHEADHVVAGARAAYQAVLSDEDFDARRAGTEATLRREWGPAYESKLAGAYHLARVFEERFGSHADFDKAIDGGLWIDADVLRTLAAAAERRGVGSDAEAIKRLRVEADTVNQGSRRANEINRELERRYRRLYPGSAS
jgi:hypothetical protein